MSSLQVLITRLDPELPLPQYSNGGDAGADIVSRIDITLAPGERALVPTGISIALPDGYVALVHPRSGLAIKHGVTMVNAPGTVGDKYTALSSVKAEVFNPVIKPSVIIKPLALSAMLSATTPKVLAEKASVTAKPFATVIRLP